MSEDLRKWIERSKFTVKPFAAPWGNRPIEVVTVEGLLAAIPPTEALIVQKVKLEELRDAEKRKQFTGRKCLIWAGDGGCYWRSGGNGYSGINDAGIYDFEDAFEHSGHCGTEKHIEYHFLAALVEKPQQATGERVSKLPESFDAADWAKEFTAICATKGIVIDEGWMITWFSNAIMVGYDEAGRRNYTREHVVAQQPTDGALREKLHQAIGDCCFKDGTIASWIMAPFEVEEHLYEKLRALAAQASSEPASKAGE